MQLVAGERYSVNVGERNTNRPFVSGRWYADSQAVFIDHGTPIPEQAKRMARMAFLASRANAVLSLPLLFLMGAASHYPMLGK